MTTAFRGIFITVFLAFAAAGFAGAAADSGPQSRISAARAAGETRDKLAVDALLANIENYQSAAGNKGPYEDNLKTRLAAIESIWALGEVGDPRVLEKLAGLYNASDDVLKVNLIVTMGKMEAGDYVKTVAADARETNVVRATAFEMIEEMGRDFPSDVTASGKDGIEKGDLIYTGGIAGSIGGWGSSDLPVGHSGIFTGTEVKDGRIYVLIADCVPDHFQPGGVRNINSWKNFTHHFKYPYYGNRTTKPGPTAAQREKIVRLALKMGTKGLHYSKSHLSQKGPALFDCVGYTEYLYEQAGLNPTDNNYETGLGWPLTPWEQFESTVSNTPPVKPGLPDGKAPVITPGTPASEPDIAADIVFD